MKRKRNYTVTHRTPGSATDYVTIVCASSAWHAKQVPFDYPSAVISVKLDHERPRPSLVCGFVVSAYDVSFRTLIHGIRLFLGMYKVSLPHVAFKNWRHELDMLYEELGAVLPDYVELAEQPYNGHVIHPDTKKLAHAIREGYVCYQLDAPVPDAVSGVLVIFNRQNGQLALYENQNGVCVQRWSAIEPQFEAFHRLSECKIRNK